MTPAPPGPAPMAAPSIADGAPAPDGRPPAPPAAPDAASGSPWILLGAVGAALVAGALVGLGRLLFAAGIALELVFMAYFVRHLAFAVAALRSARADLEAPIIDTGFRPPVTVLVPCKNEIAVIDTLVDCLLALDYPAGLLQLIVIDDGSTDGTGARLDERAGDDARVDVIHREPGAPGGKSAALNTAIPRARGEVIVIFDADHRPHPDVVRRLVRHFEDPRVGAAQGRCQIVNAEDSPLTHLIALDYLGGYLVNEYGRQWLLQLPAYGGANCAIRASSLRAAGGWNVASVTEDTDITLRLLLGGERIRYDVTAVDDEEGVIDMGRYWRQRYRWARGHQQAWRDYRSAVWRSTQLSVAQKVETTMFLLGFHLPVASGCGMVLLGLWLAGAGRGSDPLGLSIVWALLFLGPLTEVGSGLLVARADRREAAYLTLFMPLFLVSVALCTKAWFDGITGRRYVWVKTQRSAEPDASGGGT